MYRYWVLLIRHKMSIAMEMDDILKSPKIPVSNNFLKTLTSGFLRDSIFEIKISSLLLVTITLLLTRDITY